MSKGSSYNSTFQRTNVLKWLPRRFWIPSIFCLFACRRLLFLASTIGPCCFVPQFVWSADKTCFRLQRLVPCCFVPHYVWSADDICFWLLQSLGICWICHWYFFCNVNLVPCCYVPLYLCLICRWYLLLDATIPLCYVYQYFLSRRVAVKVNFLYIFS